jgi:predicted NBD/HSP70 family sugar kinase
MTEGNFDPQAAIIAWANREAELKHRLEVAQWFRELEYKRNLEATDKDIEAMKTALDTEEKALRAALATYVLETGDTLKTVDGASIRRVHPLRYDKAEALAWAREKAPHLLRYAEPALDVRKFEDAVKNGQVKWDGAESVNEVQIVIDKLGHLVKNEGE